MLLQVLVIGKLSQAVVVAAAAYRDRSGFQQLTGIEQTHMVEDSGSWDTQVAGCCEILWYFGMCSANTFAVLPNCMVTGSGPRCMCVQLL